MFSKALLLFSFVVSVATALVINPHITSPRRGDEWKAGSTQTVRWSTKNIPRSHASSTGSIVLGYLNGGASDTNEHLDLEHPLAKGFLLKDGHVDVVVPNVPARDKYIIVLFGDSGNASDEFKITNTAHH
ncbi:hypothetical protein BGX26_006575 [Mortierella sp. AD094]|nr:hypothetical protein BGX26_006575 [Mortierella sp. AD094]